MKTHELAKRLLENENAEIPFLVNDGIIVIGDINDSTYTEITIGKRTPSKVSLNDVKIIGVDYDKLEFTDAKEMTAFCYKKGNFIDGYWWKCSFYADLNTGEYIGMGDTMAQAVNNTFDDYLDDLFGLEPVDYEY